ncbi:hypothetical protein RclHR1_02230015 [Rhizophagus clarus]|uniref:Kinase-like domain-containing protein n=1 Tax=Rhizophagus clarus TaxID=94130 RepID=A0A2Z6R7L7_9GLOM|nr:hypothetical protein RclHR1_02230015 [Rhizophagus clarus]GES75599.1 kinase-like domain-containing protein [Rhizophagus clarus]
MGAKEVGFLFIIIIVVIILIFGGVWGLWELGLMGWECCKHLLRNKRYEQIVVNNKQVTFESILNIIIVGKTGSGKSTLANVLLGEEKFAEVSGSNSGTKDIQSEDFSWNGKSYRVIDTIGTGDTTGISDEEIKSFIDQLLKNLNGNDIRIFFVYKDRFDKEQVKALQTFQKFKGIFPTISCITIVSSNFVDFRDGERCKADIKRLLQENGSIASVISGCKIIHVDNPPLQYGESASDIRQFSREKLLNHLDEVAFERPDIDVDEIINELRN